MFLTTRRELPPHARRRVPAGKFDHSAFGITSACAEKSTVDNGTRGYAWNYLRMRGEEGARATQRIA